MKKIFITLLAIIMCVPVLAFAGCKGDDNAINMARYFDEKVNVQIYPRTTQNETTMKLTDFTGDNKDNLRQYSEISFNGVKDWLYKMTVEKITFYMYATKTVKVQFTVLITNMKNGSHQETAPTTNLKEIVLPVDLVANTKVPVQIDVNDYFENYDSSCTITIRVQDGQSTFEDTDPETNKLVQNDFKYTILNFQVYGSHKKVW